ncbi:MAG TPA: ATP-binding protein [Candidatus Paceibacterota bacterium]|nr:ATP-binding protein [Candidatus Paceibacterota bacterium]
MEAVIPSGRPAYQKFLVTFLLYFATGVGAEYLFYSLHTGPTVLWLPAGIALALIVIWGYWQWIPIALAQLFVLIANPARPDALFIAVNIVAYTGQALFGGYVLKKLKFDGAIVHLRDVIVLLCAGAVTTAIAPTVLIWASVLLYAHPFSFWTSWSRIWVGGLMGTLIITPLITSWYYSAREDFVGLDWKRWGEAAVAMVAVGVTTYFLFWTTVLGDYGFVMIYVLFGILFLVGFRFRPRVLLVALSLSAAFGITGTFVLHAGAATLGTQFFSDELFYILIAPIFLIMGVLVAERQLIIFQLEQEKRGLAAAMDRLSEQDRSKNEFISVFAHELRNPLAPVVSTLEYLRLNEKDPENMKVVEVADQQVRIVRRLLDDLLDVSRINQRKLNLQKETVALSPIIQSAVAAVRPFYGSRGHSFWFSLPDDEVYVNADPARMTQALMNLLFNAGKYTPPGGMIELVCRREDDAVSIVVKDNGAGISPDAMPLIFEPFQQASREAAMGSGLGLGLFITRQLVEMHGGTIAAASAGINKGAEFVLRFPALQRAPATLGVRAATAFGAPGRSLDILIVDDNIAGAQALQKLLVLRGHSVRIALGADDALMAIGDAVPDMVLLDIGLPGMNGYDLAREMRKRAARIRIVALTGYGQEEDRREAERAGFDHHLTKPIGLADLERVFVAVAR